MQIADCKLEITSLGFEIKGDVRFTNAMKILDQGHGLIKQHNLDKVVIDLAGLKGFDTVILSIFLAWIRQALPVKKQVIIQHYPKPLIKLAEVSGLSELLFRELKPA